MYINIYNLQENSYFKNVRENEKELYIKSVISLRKSNDFKYLLDIRLIIQFSDLTDESKSFISVSDLNIENRKYNFYKNSTRYVLRKILL